jgi:16S rRNA (cytidine1402-2'-O)-methyltransferase
LKELERESRRLKQTQIFIETPYRNETTLATMLGTLAGDTVACVAADLTLESEFVRTRPISAWRSEVPRLKGRPAVFLLLSR